MLNDLSEQIRDCYRHAEIVRGKPLKKPIRI
jgi:hypothetical protein